MSIPILENPVFLFTNAPSVKDNTRLGNVLTLIKIVKIHTLPPLKLMNPMFKIYFILFQAKVHIFISRHSLLGFGWGCAFWYLPNTWSQLIIFFFIYCTFSLCFCQICLIYLSPFPIFLKYCLYFPFQLKFLYLYPSCQNGYLQFYSFFDYFPLKIWIPLFVSRYWLQLNSHLAFYCLV